MTTTSPVLVDFALPKHAGVRMVLAILLANVITILCAQTTFPLPFSPVPVSGLTFAVMLVGATLGWRRAAAAMVLYLAEGQFGLHVFAEGKFGWATLVGPTGGYLLSTPLAAGLIGYLAECRWDRSIPLLLVALVLGDSIMLGAGLSRLSAFVPSEKLLHMGLFPFIPGEAAKIVAVALLLPLAWRLLGVQAVLRRGFPVDGSDSSES